MEETEMNDVKINVKINIVESRAFNRIITLGPEEKNEKKEPIVIYAFPNCTDISSRNITC